MNPQPPHTLKFRLAFASGFSKIKRHSLKRLRILEQLEGKIVTHSNSRSKNIEEAEVVVGIFATDNHDAATQMAQKQILDLGQMEKIPPVCGIENFRAYKS